MKKKLISVLALVLVVSFVWVAEVDAADLVIIYDRSYLTQVLRNTTYYNQIYDDVYLNYKGVLYSFPMTNGLGSSLSSISLPVNLLPDMLLPSGFSVLITEYSSSISSIDFSSLSLSLLFLDDTSLTLVNGSDFYVTYTKSGLINHPQSSASNFSYCIAVIEFSESLLFDKGISSIVLSSTPSQSSSYVSYYAGFLIREDGILYNATYAGSGITPEQYQAIIEGIEDIGTKMEDQNESLFVPAASDTDVIAEASSKREQFDDIMNEYSSLNADLARPGVDELLPDYSSVVNGFKDDKFYESFDVFYDNAYIMFMLLATFFFATLSYIIFGKKA